MGGRGSSSGGNGGSGRNAMSKKEAGEIAKGLSTPDRQITAGQIQQLAGEFVRNPRDRREQTQTYLRGYVGSVQPNSAVKIGQELGLMNMKHTGNYTFDGKVGGMSVSVYTEPVGSNRVRVTGVRVHD